MSAIAHAFTEVNTPQTGATGSVSDIPGAAIASGLFTVDKKYLIVVTAQMNGDTNNSNIAISTLHGTTVFTNAFRESWVDSLNNSAVYGFMTVWTAVSGEGIKLQYRVTGGSMVADQISLFAMNLSDNLAENTDWFFNENTTSTGLTTTPASFASVTFTPGTASQDWLVLGWAAIDNVDVATSSIVQIARSGEASSTDPQAIKDLGDVGADPGYFLARPFTLGASSNTFAVQCATTSGTGHTHLASTIFVLNLHKFAQHTASYTIDETPLSATNYATQLRTISLTPVVAGDVWIVGACTFNRNNIAAKAEFRVQVDDADQPAAQTTDNYQFSAGMSANDVEDLALSTLANLTAAAHTIDLDASVSSTTDAPGALHRALVAITMELSAATASTSGLVDGGILKSLTRGGLVG